MSKDIQIEYVTVRTPKTIVVDGVKYPRTQWNLNVVAEYEKTGDETVLDKLKDFALDI